MNVIVYIARLELLRLTLSTAVRLQRTGKRGACPLAKLSMGMIGGGKGAFIGDVHRRAAALDGAFELVGGVFSQDPHESRNFGAALGLHTDRLADDWRAFLTSEASRSREDQIDLMVITTPNHLHVPISIGALEAGFHVLCEKPIARTMSEAASLIEAVERNNGIYAVANTYLGYPMVHEARALSLNDALGPLRKVIVEYTQGWLAEPIEADGQKQASWRTDPERAGAAGALGDIGVHASSLVEFVTGQHITELCADVTAFVPGRPLDDDASLLFRMEGSLKGVMTVSQICTGEANNLTLRLYGERAGLEWRQHEPDALWLKPIDGPVQKLRAGVDHAYLSAGARARLRLPAGHPEGFIEALANIYGAVHTAILQRKDGKTPEYPDARMGLRGLAFIDAALENMAGTEKWTRLHGEQAS